MKKGFTLIEIVVVVAIISVLAIVVMLTLNPAELFKQSRDGSRVSDMNTLNKAISLYYSDAIGNPSTLFMGTSSLIYVSVPDPSATSTAGDQCQGLGLPTPPTGYTYQCAPTSTYRSVSGTGWIPINFTSYLSGKTGSVIQTLPVDPTNTTSTNLYYTYETDGVGGYKLTTFFESQKYAAQMATDGGNDPELYEKGTNLALAPGRGLVGYWPFSEGMGSSTIDYSGNNNTGTWSGTTAGSTGYYSAGKIPPWAGAFNGSNDYVNLGLPTNLNTALTGSAFTISAWVYSTISTCPATPSSICGIFTSGQTSPWRLGLRYDSISPSTYGYDFYINAATGADVMGPVITTNTWQFITATFNTSGGMKLYFNGSLYASSAYATPPVSNSDPFLIGDDYTPASARFWEGYIDDVRVYDRTLSASEILEMYNATK